MTRRPVLSWASLLLVAASALALLSVLDLLATGFTVWAAGKISSSNDEVTFTVDGMFIAISGSYLAVRSLQDFAGLAVGVHVVRQTRARSPK